MPYYPQTTFTSSKLKASRYPDRTLYKDVRLPGGANLLAGQVLYELQTAANAVQTVTLGGTPSGGSFTLLVPSARGYDSVGPIPWSGTAATLLSNIQTALDLFFGPSQVVATGSGPFTLTYSGSLVAGVDAPVPTAVNGLTGTSPTVTVAQTTKGSGGIGFYELYTGSYSSTTNVSFAVLESNTRTAADGSVIDEHGPTNKQAVPAIVSGFFAAANLTGLDTSILPNGGGVLGKFVTGGWSGGSLIAGSEVYIR